MTGPSGLEALRGLGGKRLSEALDEIQVPVLVFGPTLTACIGNKQARERFQRDRCELEGCRPGDLLDCVYAKGPGGCGAHARCAACVVRNAILRTISTGAACVRVPAEAAVESGGRRRTLKLTLSTEKVGDAVVLRLDEVR